MLLCHSFRVVPTIDEVRGLDVFLLRGGREVYTIWSDVMSCQRRSWLSLSDEVQHNK